MLNYTNLHCTYSTGKGTQCIVYRPRCLFTHVSSGHTLILSSVFTLYYWSCAELVNWQFLRNIGAEQFCPDNLPSTNRGSQISSDAEMGSKC